MRVFIMLFYILLISSSIAQGDSNKYFTYSEYLQIVLKHHPVSCQANLKKREGEVLKQKAKGAFDPKLIGTVSQKYYDDKQYYSYLNGSLKVPMWFGIETFAGYDNNDGVRLNPESYSNSQGLWNAGISMNLGKGLMIDQRRADLKQSEIMRTSTVLERRIILNQLLFDASVVYFEWYKAYEKAKLYEDNLNNIKTRYSNVVESVAFGDKPAIDTLKIGIQIQDRKIKLMQTELDLQNKKALLNTYLWQDGFIPLELDTVVSPKIDTIIVNVDVTDIELLLSSHPKILIQENNISFSKINYRLKRENLKPTLKIKYNTLSNGQTNNTFSDYSITNYNWSASVSYPIFTRKERAEVKLSELKLENNKAKLLDVKANVKYSVISAVNKMESYKEQLYAHERAVLMYEALLKSEQQLFDIGESSLFLINTRDQNLINAEIKLLEAIFEYRVSESLMNFYSMSMVNS